MELDRSPADHLQTLNPRMRSNPCFPSLAPRRSHLDSASYRTLSRIFSVCLEESISPAREHRKDPNTRASADKDSILDGEGTNFDRTGTEIAAEVRNAGGGGCSGVEVSKEAGFKNAQLDGAISGNSLPFEESRDGDGVCGELSKDPVSEKPWSAEAIVKELFLEGEEGQGRQENENNGCGDGVTWRALLLNDPVLERAENEIFSSDKNDGELLDKLVLDLFGDQNDLFCSAEGLEGGQRQVGAGELSNSESRKDVGSPRLSNFKDQMVDGDKQLDDCVSMTGLKVLSAENSKSTGSEGKIHHGKMGGEGLADGIRCPSAKNTGPDKPGRIDALDGNFGLAKDSAELIKNEENSYSGQVMDANGSRKWQEDQLNSLVTSNNSVEIEEGEIPDDLCISGQSLILVREDDEVLMDGTLGEESMRCDFAKKRDPDDTVANHYSRNIEHLRPNERNSRENESVIGVHHKEDGVSNPSGDDRYLEPEMIRSCSVATKANAEFQAVVLGVIGVPGENPENLADENKGRPSNVEAPEVRMKRKRVLTEERKAKKKKAKRKRRAQMEREQGVKRLRLQPIVKPKVVKYCNFFLKGRCQQGDLCRFSHDTTPLTKSQPCRYFASDLCLKGDDCPFDHQLCKYPCHNYLSKGMCIRGDKCKFSHKIEISEGLSSASTINELDSQLTTEKLKQHCMNTSSTVAHGPSVTMSSSTLVSTHKRQEASSLNSQKEPMRIPRGIRFLSFEKGPLACTNERQSNLLLEKHGGVKACNQQDQEKVLMDGHISSTSSAQKRLVKAQCDSKTMGSGAVCYPISRFASKTISFGSRKAASSCSSSIESEASKILEEFLFTNGV